MTALVYRDGRLALSNGIVLEVNARGPGAEIRWTEGALELRASAPPGDGEDATVALVLRHPLASPTQVWVPHLAPEEGDVMGDAVFRSPAILIASDAIAIAFVPDLDDVAAARGWRAWLDYDHPRATVTLAAGAYTEVGHLFYQREPLEDRADVALRLHVLVSERAEDCANPYGMAARWIWERWGRRGLEGPPRPAARMMEHVVRWAFSNDGWGESVWQRVEPDRIEGGTSSSEALAAPVFIVDVSRHPSVPHADRRWREPRSLWNQAWFSTQRCANGLLRYARQTGSADLAARAHQMTALALAAPQREGLFPSMLLATGDTEEARWRWTNSTRRPPSVSEHACHLVDAAFTCRMLLEWHALTGDGRARDRVVAFADRLVRLQRPSDAFPGWVEPDGRVPAELVEGPESAVGVTLLFELAASDPDRWRDAALAGLPFLEGIAHAGRWEDFETYYSCAPWGSDRLGEKIARNGVYKQNTLSIAWCAEAFLRAWQATRARRWLDLARRCVDELALYQAVWDPPWLPAPAHGGFGVMNGDCEWNDARQSLFAPLLLELGGELEDETLVERGVGAMRAAFSMLYCPENADLRRAYEARHPFFGPESYGFMMENQGHSPSDPIGTFTIFTWGNGSALAAAATVRDRFPEVLARCGLEP